jgi:hypothetical protein
LHDQHADDATAMSGTDFVSRQREKDQRPQDERAQPPAHEPLATHAIGPVGASMSEGAQMAAAVITSVSVIGSDKPSCRVA